MINFIKQILKLIFNLLGYAPDPIADWKKKATKMQGLTALEDDEPEESEEEPEPEEVKGKPVDPG